MPDEPDDVAAILDGAMRRGLFTLARADALRRKHERGVLKTADVVSICGEKPSGRSEAARLVPLVGGNPTAWDRDPDRMRMWLDGEAHEADEMGLLAKATAIRAVTIEDMKDAYEAIVERDSRGWATARRTGTAIVRRCEPTPVRLVRAQGRSRAPRARRNTTRSSSSSGDPPRDSDGDPPGVAIAPWEDVLPWMALAHGLEIRERLQAIIDELGRLDADVDVPRTIAEGLLEEIEAALEDEASGWRVG